MRSDASWPTLLGSTTSGPRHEGRHDTRTAEKGTPRHYTSQVRFAEGQFRSQVQDKRTPSDTQSRAELAARELVPRGKVGIASGRDRWAADEDLAISNGHTVVQLRITAAGQSEAQALVADDPPLFGIHKADAMEVLLPNGFRKSELYQI
jgi:hypothetical protein